MLTDPLSITYNSVAKSLVRISTTGHATRYRTADSEFEVMISKTLQGTVVTVQIDLIRNVPDPNTSTDMFLGQRAISNVFGLTYRFDASQYQTSVDIPLLRSALLAFVDSTLQGRLVSGEM